MATGAGECHFGEPDLKDLCVCRNLEWMQITWSGEDSFVQTPYLPRDAILSSATGLYGPIIAKHTLVLPWHYAGGCRKL